MICIMGKNLARGALQASREVLRSATIGFGRIGRQWLVSGASSVLRNLCRIQMRRHLRRQLLARLYGDRTIRVQVAAFNVGRLPEKRHQPRGAKTRPSLEYGAADKIVQTKSANDESKNAKMTKSLIFNLAANYDTNVTR